MVALNLASRFVRRALYLIPAMLKPGRDTRFHRRVAALGCRAVVGAEAGDGRRRVARTTGVQKRQATWRRPVPICVAVALCHLADRLVIDCHCSCTARQRTQSDKFVSHVLPIDRVLYCYSMTTVCHAHCLKFQSNSEANMKDYLSPTKLRLKQRLPAGMASVWSPQRVSSEGCPALHLM